MPSNTIQALLPQHSTSVEHFGKNVITFSSSLQEQKTLQRSMRPVIPIHSSGLVISCAMMYWEEMQRLERQKRFKKSKHIYARGDMEQRKRMKRKSFHSKQTIQAC